MRLHQQNHCRNDHATPTLFSKRKQDIRSALRRSITEGVVVVIWQLPGRLGEVLGACSDLITERTLKVR